MSVWIKNLRGSLEDRPVVILHGNVRDKYIDERGVVYENLTELLRAQARGLKERGLAFSEFVFYDPVGIERREAQGKQAPMATPSAPADDELGGAAAPKVSNERKRPDVLTTLAAWARDLSSTQQNLFVALYYLDKLTPYKTSYADDEMKTLLWLEKVVENITPNHRLVMVALQDTLIPIELYTSSPKTRVLAIPAPDRADREAYLRHRLGDDFAHIALIANLTDGLYLRDLDNLIEDLRANPAVGEREVRQLVNKYRIGEQQDYWSELSIEQLNGALPWFTEQEGVKGQDEPIIRVLEMLYLARAGLTGLASGNASKPKGVLFFAGPTGVGKTLVAKKLAKFLFSTEEAFLRFDMSELKEEHTVSRLIGSPPGYVGYERGGMLTNAVRERPFSIVLFDEVEKAHPKIMDIFLQILDDGRLTDGRGQTVFFSETVIIFTTNLGTRTNDSRGNPVGERARLEEIRANASLTPDDKRAQIGAHFIEAVERFFTQEISRPELLNRIGSNIVPFNFIDLPDVQHAIVRARLREITSMFEDKYRAVGHTLRFDDDVIAWLVANYGEKMAEFGGRGISNALERQVMLPLARAVLRVEYSGRQRVALTVGIDAQRGPVVREGASVV